MGVPSWLITVRLFFDDRWNVFKYLLRHDRAHDPISAITAFEKQYAIKIGRPFDGQIISVEESEIVAL